MKNSNDDAVRVTREWVEDYAKQCDVDARCYDRQAADKESRGGDSSIAHADAAEERGMAAILRQYITAVDLLRECHRGLQVIDFTLIKKAEKGSLFSDIDAFLENCALTEEA